MRYYFRISTPDKSKQTGRKPCLRLIFFPDQSMAIRRVDTNTQTPLQAPFIAAMPILEHCEVSSFLIKTVSKANRVIPSIREKVASKQSEWRGKLK